MSQDSSNGNGNGASARWQVTLSVGTFIVIVVGAIVTFFVQESTLSSQSAALQQRVMSLEAQQASIIERLITERTRIDDRANNEHTEVARINASLVEVETQFCAQDIVRNLMHANDLRIFAMLWRKEFPDTFLPTDNAYYPTICNREIKYTNGAR